MRAAAQRAAAAAPGVRAAGGAGRRRRPAHRGDAAARARRRPARRQRRRRRRPPSAAAWPPGLLDRLRLTPERLADMATQLEVLADTPEPPLQREVRTLPTGERVFERRVPVGVIGAVFEARPNVTVDVASQVLKARSAAVLRTGSAALGVGAGAGRPRDRAGAGAHGVPAGAVQLVPTPGHAGAEALVGLPDLVPLVVVRGSGEVTRRLSALGAAAGTRVLAHADGGGVLYLDASADRGRRHPAGHRQHRPARRLQPAQPAARSTAPPTTGCGRSPRRPCRARASPRACPRTPTRSATSGRSTPAPRRTSPSPRSTARSTPRDRGPRDVRPGRHRLRHRPRPRPRRSSTPTPAPACSGTPPPACSTATSCSACPRPASTSTTRRARAAR